MNLNPSPASSNVMRTILCLIIAATLFPLRALSQEQEAPPEAIARLGMMLENPSTDGLDAFMSSYIDPERLAAVGVDRFRDVLTQAHSIAQEAGDIVLAHDGGEHVFILRGRETVSLGVALTDNDPPLIAGLRMEVGDGPIGGGSPMDVAIESHVRAVESLVSSESDEAINEFIAEHLSPSLRNREGDFALFSTLRGMREAARSAQGIGVSRAGDDISMSFEGPEPITVALQFQSEAPFLITRFLVSHGNE